MKRTAFSHKLSSFALLLGAMGTLLLASPGQIRAESAPKDIVDTAISAGTFDTLVAAVKAAGLADTLKGDGPFTVFAPTDQAFQSLPKGTVESLLKPENKEQLVAILTYHVVAGRVSAADAYGLSSAATVNGQRLEISRREGKLVIGEAGIVATDVNCLNGVVHVIDRVLLPKQQRIPAVAQQAGTFNTLLAAVTAGDLAGVLGSDGPFTVFAPTDDAFAKLPEGTVDTLLKMENKQKLVDILKYHVVSGRVYSDQAAQAGRATTLQGQRLEATVTAEGLRINDALVVQADLDTANGVIHVINAVLIPETMTPRQAMRVMTEAINRGVPIFNRGHHRECADIYTAACQMIVDSDSHRMPKHVMTTLQGTLSRSSHLQHSSQRAWALRHGMDSALSALRQMTLASADN